MENQLAGIVVLYHFLFSSFDYIVYMFKTGEQKVIKDNDSCQLQLPFFPFLQLQLQLQLLFKKISNYDYFSITVIVIEITVIAITLGSIIHL